LAKVGVRETCSVRNDEDDYDDDYDVDDILIDWSKEKQFRRFREKADELTLQKAIIRNPKG
jgi:hypothetical protein